MQPDDRGTARPSQAVDLLAAIARREASPQDITAELRKQGVDALDLVVALAARALRPRADNASAQGWIDISQFAKPTNTQAAARIVHRVPKVPFVLNGTLYDPKDIARFNGRELHFVANEGELLLVIDERPVISRWWEFTYLTSLAASAEKVEQYQYGGHPTGVYPQSHGGKHGQAPPDTGGTSGPMAPSKPVGTYLFEDAWHQGESVLLRPNRGFPDLTKVGRGFLGLGDWNDVISSVQLYFTYVCVLFEHIHYGGSSLTLYRNVNVQHHHYLEDVGWNDHVSSVQTW